MENLRAVLAESIHIVMDDDSLAPALIAWCAPILLGNVVLAARQRAGAARSR